MKQNFPLQCLIKRARNKQATSKNFCCSSFFFTRQRLKNAPTLVKCVFENMLTETCFKCYTTRKNSFVRIQPQSAANTDATVTIKIAAYYLCNIAITFKMQWI